MFELPWFIITVVGCLLVGFFVTIYLMRRKGYKPTPNYRALFIIGIAIIVVGMSGKNIPLSGLGLIYMAIGLFNRKKWGEQTKWRDLPPAMRRFKIGIIIVLGLLVVLGVVFYLLQMYH